MAQYHWETLMACAFFIFHQTLHAMRAIYRNRIFDTVIDTTKTAVSVKTYFRMRTYPSSPEVGHIYLFVSGSEERERINVELEVPAKDWNPKLERLVETTQGNRDINLILDSYIAKVTETKTVYRLQHKLLTPTILKHEIRTGMIRVDFIPFAYALLEDDKALLKNSTYLRNKIVLDKLAEYKSSISFSELSISFFSKYRLWLQRAKGNARGTINGNIIVIKKFLLRAPKFGILLNFDPEDIVGGTTRGNRIHLNPEEVKRLLKIFELPMIDPSSKLVLGYFLFACMTGMRISDIMKTTRKQLLERDLSFVNKKSSADQVVELNKIAMSLVIGCEDLFVKFFSEKHINHEIKRLVKFCNIDKHVFFHTARHTFATCFLRAGGTVHHLQKLLKHKSITTTMIYVHILEEEANEQVYILDKLFA